MHVFRSLFACFTAAFATFVFSFSMVTPAMGHPLDDLTIRRINQYFIVDARGRQPTVFYLLKMAEIPSFDEMNKIDPDYNRDVTGKEVNAYLDHRISGLLENLHMAVDGSPVPLNVKKRRLKLNKGKGGMSVISIYMTLTPGSFAWPAPGQTFELVIRSDNFTGVLGERECKVLHNGRLGDPYSEPDKSRNGFQKLIYRDDLANAVYQNTNAHFVFKLTALKDPVTAIPLEPTFGWITKTKLTTVDQDKARRSDSRQTWAPKVQGQPGGVADIDKSENRGSAVTGPLSFDYGAGILSVMFEQVAGTIRAKELTTRMFLSGLLIAMFLGIAHAWSPGHGKTVMAAYLIGERGTVWNAVILGVVVTITHTWSVLGIGAVALYAQEVISSEKLNFWLSMASGGLILLIGVMLFFRRYTAFILERHKRSSGDHYHGHDHDHLHDGDHTHCHGHHRHSHVVKTNDGSPPGIWSILGLGISGGIVPCASALIVLLLAIHFKRPAYGLGLILSFSLGLAFVLIFLGIIVVRAKGVVQKRIGRGQALVILPVVSSALIAMMGLALLLGTLVQYRFIVFQL